MIKSDKQLAIEFRNSVAARMIERRANISYWQYIKKQCKHNTPEIIEAINNISANEGELEKDKIFIKCIDKIVKETK